MSEWESEHFKTSELKSLTSKNILYAFWLVYSVLVICQYKLFEFEPYLQNEC